MAVGAGKETTNGIPTKGVNGMANKTAVNEHLTHAPVTDPRWVPLNKESLFTPRKIRVICIGAGYAGLTLLYKWKYKMKLDKPVQVEVYPDHEDFAVRTLGMPGLGALGVTFGDVVAMDVGHNRRQVNIDLVE